jgi:hypothetical protein
MATVTKDFRVKHGLIVEGTTGTINGSNILTTANNTGDLTEGTNLYFTDARAKTSAADLLTNATLTNITITGNGSGLTITAENGVADSTTDDLTEGSTNLYFTDARAVAAVESATFNSLEATFGFTGDGLYVEQGGNRAGSVYGVEGQYLVVNSSQDLVLSAGAGYDVKIGNDVVATQAYADQAESDAVATAAADATSKANAAESNANTYTDGRETAITAAYEAYADTAEADAITSANSYTDGRETAITTAYQSYADTAEADAISTAAADATSKANTAESNANSYTDDLIGDVTVDGTSGNTVADRIASAVSGLVDSAPGTLDTLNELAAALGDDANFSTTVTNSIAEKVAKSGDTMTGFLTLHADPTNALHAVTKQYVDAAVSSGVGGIDTDAVPEGDNNLYYTTERAQEDAASLLTNATLTNITITGDGDGLTITAENGVADSDTDDLTEGSSNLYFTDQRAVDALEAVVPNFTEVDINSVATQVAATINLSDTNQTAAYSFDSGSYRSAKFVVKAAYGTHTEVSEILVTLDTSDNIAITEYAIVSTNGSLIDVTAGMNGTDVEILATAGTANTDVTVVGTLIA